jgi:protein-disulfide isomerase
MPSPQSLIPSHLSPTTMKPLLISLLLLILSACAGAPAQADPTATVVLAATLAPEETATVAAVVPSEEAAQEATPSPEVVEEPADWSQTVFVEGDFFVRGNPAAPIRLVDYSDFL